MVARKDRQMATHDENRQLTIDLDRLSDDLYMDSLTSTQGWRQLEVHMKALFIVELLGHLRRGGEDDDLLDRVVDAFLANLSDEDRKDIQQTLDASDLLDTLVLALGRQEND